MENTEEKKPNFIKRAWAKHKEKVSKKDRKQGQLATGISLACETVYLSGMVDQYPKLQVGCHIGAILFGAIAGRKAFKNVEK